MRRFAVVTTCAALAGAGDVPAVTVADLIGSARGQALGGIESALAGDGAAVWRSPAAGAPAGAWMVSTGGGRTFAEAGLWQALASAPVGPVRLTGAAAGYVWGEVLLRAQDGTERTVAGRSDLGVLANVSGEPWPGLTAGISSRFVDVSLLAARTARVGAVDAGASWRGAGFTAGIAGLDLAGWSAGPALATGRKVAMGVMVDRPVSPAGMAVLGLLGGLDWETGTNAVIGRVGAELRLAGALAVRAGWHRGTSREVGELSAGLGAAWRGYRLDLAAGQPGEFSAPLTATVSWTGVRRATLPGAAAVPAAPVPSAAPAAVFPEPRHEPAAPAAVNDRTFYFYPELESAVRFSVTASESTVFSAEVASLKGETLRVLEPPRRVVAGPRVVEWDGTLGGAPVLPDSRYVIRIRIGGQTQEYIVVVRPRP